MGIMGELIREYLIGSINLNAHGTGIESHREYIHNHSHGDI